MSQPKMNQEIIDTSRIHGLVIGIDQYKKSHVYPPLGKRNVTEAKSLLRSFTNMGARRGNFVCLFNEEATLRAILHAFDEHIINNQNIKVGDPIMIYLAGYGNRTTNQPGAETEVEMILPYDINTFGDEGYVLDLPDGFLEALLRKIHQKKGDNIAVAAYCHHIATSTRGPKRIPTRSSHDPSQAAFREIFNDQAFRLFSDSSSSAAPSLPVVSTMGSSNSSPIAELNQSLPTPLNVTDSLGDNTPNQEETGGDQVDPTVEISKDKDGEKDTYPGAQTPIESTSPQMPSHSLSQATDQSEPDYSKKVIYGIIVGIDKYQRSDVHPDLLGCVADAKSVCRYFTQDLGTPEDNLLCLYDESATREAILNAFTEHLIRNPNINQYDPIVIYFAGHGTRMPAPSGWETVDGQVEMILPHDASAFDADESYIHGIPDLTLGFLLYNLSQVKGNNITVILDSCSSGSGTRGSSRIYSRHSYDRNAPPIPDTLDAQLRGSLSAFDPPQVESIVVSKKPSRTLMAPSLDTHILLAACQYNELAQEIQNIDPQSGEIGDPPSSGVFTTVLLRELRKADLAYTSYTTLIRNLLASHRDFRPMHPHHLREQTFQCEGRNQDRLLFSCQFSISKGKISLMHTQDKSVYRVRIGSAQGIVPGTEFGVFTDRMDINAAPLALLVASDVGSMMSQLSNLEPNNPIDIPEGAYATIIKYNHRSSEVRIWVDEQVRTNEFWGHVITGLELLPVFWVDLPGDHDMEILLQGEDVELRGSHLTPGHFCTSHILKFEHSNRVQRLVQILTGVVCFNFHLKLRNEEAPLRTQLEVMLRELVEKENSWGNIYEVKGGDLFGDSVSAGTVATLRASSDRLFGLELVNNSMEHLYPYVLYYDFEDYSVEFLYNPPGRSAGPPLPAGKKLAIGYGSGGSQPIQLDLTNRQSVKEHGVFVVMLFSEWVDIGYLKQESPLNGDAEATPRAIRGAIAKLRIRASVWDSIVIRVDLISPKQY